MGPFEKVHFHICGPGADIVSKLISGGGKRSSYLSNCVTVNIVTDDAEEDVFDKMKIEEAEEVWGITSVSADWVNESYRVGTALPFQPFLYHSQTSCKDPKSRYFSGTVAFIDPDIQICDKDKLWAMLTWHGGKVAASLRCPGITHIITTSSRLDNEDHCEVTPDWITETCRRGQRLLEYDFCPEEHFVDCVEEPVDNNNIIKDINNGNRKKNSKRKLCFDGMDVDADSDNYFSCDSSSSSQSSYVDKDSNSNSFKRIIHTPLPKRLKL